MINYSIIIPHRNSIKLLLRLLESIPENDSFQIIVVDDNSDTPFLKELKTLNLNSNVKLIFCDVSRGAGAARNIGLTYAKGKWILFADADDFFVNGLEVLLNKYLQSDVDVVYFDTDSQDESGWQTFRHLRYSKLVKDFLHDTKKEDALRYFFTVPWGKMIKRDLILSNNIKFDEIVASNDVMFSLKTSFFAERIKACPDILYIVSLSAGSVSKTISRAHFDSKFKTVLKANEFLCSIGMRKYQQSVLYFLGRSYKFGLNYVLYVLIQLIRYRSNIFIGANKFLKIKNVLMDRENKI